MTSIVTVKKEVQQFLDSDKPGVLCITGKWGTGKTFAWREMVKVAADTQKLGLKKYSYVSLFGITSLTELRTNIAESMQILQSEIGQPYLSTVRDESYNLFLKSVKVLKNFTSAIPYIGKALSDSQALYFPLVVNDALVCLDDLDRHSAQLRVNDILGLVTSLRVILASEVNWRGCGANVSSPMGLAIQPICAGFHKMAISGLGPPQSNCATTRNSRRAGRS